MEGVERSGADAHSPPLAPTIGQDAGHVRAWAGEVGGISLEGGYAVTSAWTYCASVSLGHTGLPAGWGPLWGVGGSPCRSWARSPGRGDESAVTSGSRPGDEAARPSLAYDAEPRVDLCRLP